MSYIKCMIIVILTVYLVTISLSDSEFHEVQDYYVFECFLFNLVSISGGELYKVIDYCVFDCFLFLPCHHFSW